MRSLCTPWRLSLGLVALSAILSAWAGPSTGQPSTQARRPDIKVDLLAGGGDPSEAGIVLAGNPAKDT